MLHMRPGFRDNIRSAVTANISTTGMYLSTTRGRFGGSAIYNNATNTYMTISPVSAGALGPGDWTIEFWYYPLSLAGGVSFYGTRPPSTNGPYPTVYLTGSTLILYTQGTFVISGTTSLTANTWNACAVVKRSGVTSIYINGVQSGNTYTDTNNYLASSFYMFGDDYSSGSGSNLNGYCSEYRVSNIARYSSNYTPATQPFIDDLNTILLFHFNGENNSRTIVDDNS